MTRGEWLELDLPVEWVLYLYDYSHDKETDPNDYVLDLRAPTDDGVYDGYFDDGYYGHPVAVEAGEVNPFKPQHLVSGITVEDGMFVPEPTAQAIYELVRPTELDRFGNRLKDGDQIQRKFVERCQYNPFGNYFYVFVSRY